MPVYPDLAIFPERPEKLTPFFFFIMVLVLVARFLGKGDQVELVIY